MTLGRMKNVGKAEKLLWFSYRNFNSSGLERDDPTEIEVTVAKIPGKQHELLHDEEKIVKMIRMCFREMQLFGDNVTAPRHFVVHILQSIGGRGDIKIDPLDVATFAI